MSIQKKIIGLTLKMLLSSELAVAADFDKGKKAYESNDGVTALLEFMPLAEEGHIDAQFWLGDMFDWGTAVEKNSKTAVKWWDKAARQGHAMAQLNLGFAYESGVGILTDTKRAYMWYSLATYNGNQISDKVKKI